jgi:type IV secretory pathway VirB10-like protein
MELFMRAEGDMKWMAQPRSALELCAVRCCRLEREQSAEALVERLKKLEDKLSNLSSIPFEPTTSKPAAPPPKPEGAPAQAAPPVPPKPEKVGKGAEPAGSDKYLAAMESIQKEQPQIYGMLKDGVFRGLDGDSVLVELPRARSFYRQILEKEDKKALIDQALAASFGRAAAVRFVQGGEAPRADARTLEQAYDVFGREKVSVLDE